MHVGPDVGRGALALLGPEPRVAQVLDDGLFAVLLYALGQRRGHPHGGLGCLLGRPVDQGRLVHRADNRGDREQATVVCSRLLPVERQWRDDVLISASVVLIV